MTNTLCCRDNLEILQRYVADESVDLIYLEPPFNSNRNCDILFKEEDGRGRGKRWKLRVIAASNAWESEASDTAAAVA